MQHHAFQPNFLLNTITFRFRFCIPLSISYSNHFHPLPTELHKMISPTIWSWWSEITNNKQDLALALLIFAIITLVISCYKSAGKSTSPLPPGPRGLPVVGYLPFLGPNLHHQFANLAQIYGPIFKLKLGSKTHIVVSSPELAEVVAREHDEIFSNRDPPAVAVEISHGGQNILWADNNSHWRNMRKVFVYEILSGKNLEASHTFRQADVRKTVKRVFDTMGTEVDVGRVMFLSSLNVITSMIWGKSLVDGEEIRDGVGVELREVLSRIVELLGTANVSDFFPVLAGLDLQGVVREMKRRRTVVEGFFDRIITERMASKVEETVEEKGRRDFLQTLLELKDQNSSSSFNVTQIKALFMDTILGATDTTSTMVEWIMAELLRNPKIMKDVQDELEDVVGLSNIVEESHIPKLRYLDAVIKETFRLHPPLPLLITRCPNQSCKVGGYTVPKGSNVYLNVWAIHRNPEYWENPLEFTPERFINPDGTTKFDFNGYNLKYFPFGSGRRKCPGIRLGEKMLVYVLASLLHSFDWSLPDGKELELSDKFGIVLKKRKPLIAIPSQRLSDKTLYIIAQFSFKYNDRIALDFATTFLSHIVQTYSHPLSTDLHKMISTSIWSRWSEITTNKHDLTLALLICPIITFFIWWIKSVRNSTSSSLPPGPRGLPLVGYLPFLGPNLHHEFTKLAQIYGPIFKLKLGSKTHMVVSSPELAEAVAREHDDIFANRDPPAAAVEMSQGGQSIVWADNNSLWRNMRKVIVYEVLSTKNLEASRTFRLAEVRKTVNRVYDTMGTEVDFGGVMFLMSLNVITSMIWGKSLAESNGVGVELREHLSRIVELLGTANVSDFFPVVARLDLQGVVREMKRRKTVVDGIFDRIINERMASKVEETVEQKGRKDFLQILLELKEQNTTSSFTFTQIKTLFMESIIGATDTTSTMVEWIMAELLQHPKIMKDVQNELEQVVGLNNIVEESHIPRLRYLDAVIKETFRLHPPLPLLVTRCPNQSCKVGGYTVPKGTNVYLNVWAIHRNPEYWKNPLEFTPERFINPDGTTKFDFNGYKLKYFPFGSGRRKCPGIRLGEKMLVYVLASLLHSFDWSLPDNNELDLSDKFGIVLKKRKPLIAIPSQRLPNKNLYTK
ncbi:hypothetical protein OSB04_022527 [Centaurea solstitialis]|uniref:Cytochrome P450 n=1 Tax=Centaurea solstitialis TaxID=347529 RepID=A0AA38SXY6_9ASTR|nr:hypothetical protein OSB04_022527 [Centaurea solstitialis]